MKRIFLILLFLVLFVSCIEEEKYKYVYVGQITDILEISAGRHNHDNALVVIGSERKVIFTYTRGQAPQIGLYLWFKITDEYWSYKTIYGEGYYVLSISRNLYKNKEELE